MIQGPEGKPVHDEFAPESTLGATDAGLRIAFLEDDHEQAERIKDLLEEAGHHVYVFDRGRALLGRLRTDTFELIVLDWEVPDLSGFDVLTIIRTQLDLRTPVLFLTNRDAESDVVRALKAGADDFLIKPPRERELLARVESMGRRVQQHASKRAALENAPYRIDLERHELTRDGVRLELTRREFDVAVLLFSNMGKVLSRGYIMDALWGRGDTTTSRTVDMHVSRVRKILGLSAATGVRLTAIYGYGYRLEQTTAAPT